MLVTDIIRQVGRSFGDTDQIIVTNADIFDWINEAQLKICQKTECLTTEVLYAASTFPHAFPADFIRTNRLLYGVVPLDEIGMNKLDDLGIDLTQRNTPLFYFYKDRKFNLYPLQPTADTTVVTIGYVQQATIVAGLASTLDTPAVYHDEIIKYCLAKAHERNENASAMQAKMAEFNEGIHEDMDDNFNKTNAYPVIGDDPWEDW